jgi:hypothetical protein
MDVDDFTRVEIEVYITGASNYYAQKNVHYAHFSVHLCYPSSR